MGSGIVRELAKTHSNLRVLTRDSNRVRNRVQGVEYISGDLSDVSSLQKAMENCDTVINAAQFDNAPFENPRKGLTYEKIDAQGTEHIVEAAKKTGISRILYISGAGVDENKTESWFRAKSRAEKSIKNSGMKWTIFRPSWIYGPGDRSLNQMIPMVRYSPVVFIVGKDYWIQPIFINDVAKIVSSAVENPKTFDQIYELGGPEHLTMKEILQKVAYVIGRKKIYVSIPKSWVGLAFSILEKVPGSIITRAALDFITMNIRISENELKKVENDFNIQPQSLTKGLQTYL